MTSSEHQHDPNMFSVTTQHFSLTKSSTNIRFCQYQSTICACTRTADDVSSRLWASDCNLSEAAESSFTLIQLNRIKTLMIARRHNGEILAWSMVGIVKPAEQHVRLQITGGLTGAGTLLNKAMPPALCSRHTCRRLAVNQVFQLLWFNDDDEWRRAACVPGPG